MSRSPITTHVLDTARGRPAAGVLVTLEQRTADGFFKEVGVGATNSDGRIADLLEPGTLVPGVYRITFETASYFAAIGTTGFYPEVVVTFEIRDVDEHYHVPLLISPYGFSTYRGS